MEPENKTSDRITELKKRMIYIKTCVFRISEYWYTGMLILLTIRTVLQYVQMDIIWEDLGQGNPVILFLITYFLMKPNYVLLIIAVVRHVCADQYDIKKSFTAIAIYFVTAHAVEINHYDEVMMMLLLMIGAWGISFRKLIKIYFVTVLVIVTGVVLASQIGWIEELIYEVRGGRRAFGFTYPTRFASHVSFLILWYWYLRGRKTKYREIWIPIGAGIFVQLFSKARLNAIILLLLAVVMTWQIFSLRNSEHSGKEYQMKGWFSSFLALSPILATLMITTMTVLYSADSKMWSRLNKLMSSRLSLVQNAMDIYGFQMWGQEITLSGNGGLGKTASKYFYIDSAWMQFSIQYGLIMLVILLVLFWIVGIRARNHGNWILLWILAFVSLHSIVEPQILQLQYCPLILAFFAELKKNDTGKMNYEEN